MVQENVIAVSFKNNDDAYKALSDLKNSVSSFIVLSARLIEKVGNTYVQKDGYDADSYGSNFAEGGLIGALIGIIGGPIGILLGGGIGMLIGSASDSDKENSNEDVMMEVMNSSAGGLLLVMVVQESDPEDLNKFLANYDVNTLTRESFTSVQRKIIAAEKAQKKLAKEAHDKMVEQKHKSFKKRIQAREDELKARFSKVKSDQSADQQISNTKTTESKITQDPLSDYRKDDEAK